MPRADRATPGSQQRRSLILGVGLFFAAAALWVASLATGARWLDGVAILVLLVGLLLRAAHGRSPAEE